MVRIWHMVWIVIGYEAEQRGWRTPTESCAFKIDWQRWWMKLLSLAHRGKKTLHNLNLWQKATATQACTSKKLQTCRCVSGGSAGWWAPVRTAGGPTIASQSSWQEWVWLSSTPQYWASTASPLAMPTLKVLAALSLVYWWVYQLSQAWWAPWCSPDWGRPMAWLTQASSQAASTWAACCCVCAPCLPLAARWILACWCPTLPPTPLPSLEGWWAKGKNTLTLWGEAAISHCSPTAPPFIGPTTLCFLTTCPLAQRQSPTSPLSCCSWASSQHASVSKQTSKADWIQQTPKVKRVLKYEHLAILMIVNGHSRHKYTANYVELYIRNCSTKMPKIWLRFRKCYCCIVYPSESTVRKLQNLPLSTYTGHNYSISLYFLHFNLILIINSAAAMSVCGIQHSQWATRMHPVSIFNNHKLGTHIKISVSVSAWKKSSNYWVLVNYSHQVNIYVKGWINDPLYWLLAN